VLGAKDNDLFVKVIFPATTPFIITAVRLGVSVALTTLIAAESTGATAGLGMRRRNPSSPCSTIWKNWNLILQDTERSLLKTSP
jgi:NitT/TauT family transport system permease protein